MQRQRGEWLFCPRAVPVDVLEARVKQDRFKTSHNADVLMHTPPSPCLLTYLF